MIGLIVLVVGAAYLAILVWATLAAYRWAKAKAWSNTKCRLAAAGGFLVAYLPVFWDHIPTLITYQYSCATEAGFWEYKTIDQWKKENPGVAETLASHERLSITRQGDMNNYVDTSMLNQRFAVLYRKSGPLFLNRWRWENTLVDTQTQTVLARSVDFSTGNGLIGMSGGDWPFKFWLQIGYCKNGDLYATRLAQTREAARSLEQRSKP